MVSSSRYISSEPLGLKCMLEDLDYSQYTNQELLTLWMSAKDNQLLMVNIFRQKLSPERFNQFAGFIFKKLSKKMQREVLSQLENQSKKFSEKKQSEVVPRRENDFESWDELHKFLRGLNPLDKQRCALDHYIKRFNCPDRELFYWGQDEEESGHTESAILFYKAIKIPTSEVLLRLGLLYEKKDMLEAEYYYTQANCAEAYYRLGKIYENGCQYDDGKYYIFRNLPRAISCYEKGSADVSLYRLGAIHENMGQQDKAIGYYIRAIPYTPEALYRLGVIHQQKAENYKRIAASYDLPDNEPAFTKESKQAMGYEATAIDYYQRAGADHKEAFYRLALLHLENKKIFLAAFFFKLAVFAVNHTEASYQLALIYYSEEAARNGLGDFAEGFRCYKEAAEQGHVKSQNWMGRRYLFGSDGKVDLAKATFWFTKAAKTGDVEAQQAVAEIRKLTQIRSKL